MDLNHCGSLLQSADDWRNHLSGTTVFREEGCVTMPYYVSEVLVEEDEDSAELGLSDIHLRCRSLTEDLSLVTASIRAGDDIVPAFPEMGVADCMAEGFTSYNYYNGRRQFRKSLNAGMVREVIPSTTGELSSGVGIYVPGGSSRMSLLSLYQIINKKYTEVEEAYTSIMRLDRFSSGLSTRFSLHTSYKSEYPALFYKDMEVGELVEARAYIYEQYSDMVEEYKEEVSNEVTIYE